MAFSTEIEKESVERNTLVVFRPRMRVTGWALHAANVYSVDFPYGRVVKVIADVTRFPTGWTETDTYPPAVATDTDDLGFNGEFYQADGVLYVGVDSDPDTRVTYPIPGLTVEFEVHVASKDFTAYADPTDATTPLVDWEGKLLSSVTPRVGYSDDVFGYQPVNVDTIDIANDGWLSEIQYDVSWKDAPVSVYHMLGSDFEKAFAQSNIKQIFIGYVSAISESGNVFSVESSDFLSTLNRNYSDWTPDFMIRFTSAMFPNVDPNAIVFNAEYYIRRIFGRLDKVQPVNIDYSSTATTTNNRDWVTHQDSETPGTYAGNVTLTVDHTASNTTTRTYFTTTPTLAEDDYLHLHHNGSEYYAIVLSVNYASKYIEHIPLVGRTIIAGDYATRYFIGNIQIKDRDGSLYDLFPFRDYLPSVNGTTGVMGFVLADNFEANVGYAHSPFDPARDTIFCRVYGTKVLGTYSDSTDVLTVSENSGVASRAGNLIYRLLTAAGVEKSVISKASFQSVAADSHTMGFSVPASLEDQTLPTYKDILTPILQSSLYKLVQINDAGADIMIGLVAIGPFASAGDYEVSDKDYSSFSWSHDYTGVYGEIVAEYGITNTSPFGAAARKFITVENDYAKQVHYSTAKYEVALAQMVAYEAEIAANRIAFVLSDRRALYKFNLPNKFLDKSGIGVSYLTNRTQLPGYAYDGKTQNQRTLSIVEVSKSSEGVSLTLDDQKGIQDNSGDW